MPNNIIGPKGTGENQIVPVVEEMPYVIEFENLPTANSPIFNSIPQTDLALSSFLDMPLV